MQRRRNDESHGKETEECESVEDQWFLGFHEERKDFRVVVENVGNLLKNAECSFRIKEDL